MNRYLRISIVVSILISAAFSCTKKDVPEKIESYRSIRFVLFTEKDFVENNDSIHFSVFIRSHSTVLFDTLLYSMKIKDIPREANAFNFEKEIEDQDGVELGVGFRYSIDNVGSGSYIDTIAAPEMSKSIRFSFK